MPLLATSFTCALRWPFQHEHRVHSGFKIRAKSLGDEGRSSNLVDSSMKILKDRMKVIRTKERLEKSSRSYGWDYDSNYTNKHEKHHEYPKTIALICVTGLPVLIGTALLYIFSVVKHLNL